MSVELSLVRQMWKLLEPVHAVLYYAPEVFAQCEKLGFDTADRWPSYFPLRAAPLGAAGAELVAAMARVAGPAQRIVVTGGWAEGEAARAVKARHLGPYHQAEAVFAGARGAALTAARAAGADPAGVVAAVEQGGS
jgi:hypothetical protein